MFHCRLLNRTHAATLFVLLSTAVSGCGEEGITGAGTPDAGGGQDTGESAETTDLKRRLLTSIADHVVLPSLAQFVADAQALELALQSYAEAPDNAQLTEARNAWRVAMLSWQAVEVMQFGPAGLMESVVGGESIRDEIYSWPLVNRCRVDQETVEPAHADPTALAAEAINVRGLAALEYLLFDSDTANACAPNSALNTDGTWAALSAEEIVARRAIYAWSASRLITQQAVRLHDFWRPESGNFRAELVNAGQGSETWPTVQDALQSISDAMFYAEKETKDMKLATPAGLRDCTTTTCPEALEHPFANTSGDAALANLRTFGALLNGAPWGEEGTGFLDLLSAAGATALVTEITVRYDDAVAVLEPLQGTMESLLVADPATVVTAHDGVKALLDLFKTEFIGVLDLDLPQRAEGDND
jgi:predicted lipoprotein